MKESKNIERLFQEKFKDFEVSPPEKSWKIIEARLQKKEEKRKIIPFWFKASGIAATLILGMFLFLNKNSNSLNEISNENLINSVTVSKKENNLDEDSPKKETPNSNLLDTNKEINSDPIVLRKNERIVSEDKMKPKEQNNFRNSSNNKETNLFKNKPSPIVAVPSSNRVLDKKNNFDVIYNKEEKVPTNNKLDVIEKDINSLVLNTSSSGKENKKQLLGNNKTPINTDLERKEDNLNVLVSNTLSNTKEDKALLSSNDKTIVSGIKDKLLKDEILKIDTNRTIDAIIAEDNKLENNDLKLDSGSLILNEIITDVMEDSTLVAEVATEENPLEKLLKEKLEGENADEKEKEKRNKWAVSSYASPVFFNSSSQGSSIDEQFVDNSKAYEKTVSYGVGLEYEISNKLRLKTGVNTLALNYSTNDVYYTTSLNPDVLNVKTISRNSNSENIILKDKKSLVELDNINRSETDSKGALSQSTSYIEVPLELSFSLLNKKFGIDIIGGMSTLFLNENKVSIVSAESKMNIGEANNLNNIHFSSNVGLGFKYTFWKSFQANFQPMFKYQINTFSNDSGNFRPYFIGLYSGLSFSF